MQRKVRQLLAEGKTVSYEKAELATRLMNLNFDEDESIYAANECSSLYSAISYLQQDCELCASKYPVKEVSCFRISISVDSHKDIYVIVDTDDIHVALRSPLLQRMCPDVFHDADTRPQYYGRRVSVLPGTRFD